MPVDFLAKWKSDLSDLIPLDSMDRILSGWKYAPVAESEDSSHPSRRSLLQNARECMNSKAFWRTILVLISLLLLANLFSPAKGQLQKYGWLSPDGRASYGSSPGSEILDDPLPTDGVNWHDFAYCQYVTNEDYLCNSLMIFESLVRLKAKAEMLMMYPEEWVVGDNTKHGRLLAQARDEYGVRLVPIFVKRLDGESTWAESFTKLLAFNQTMYKRVLSLDSDGTVLQPMDELFLLPSAPVGMPRAYWLDRPYLSSQLVLIEPSKFEFQRIEAAFSSRGSKEYDMEIVNNLYGSSCFIIPHRKYDLLTGEFKGTEHWKYLGSREEEWDPDKVIEEAKFLHFSDWPLPKPWIEASEGMVDAEKPECRQKEGGEEDCRDQKKWLWFYDDFRERRLRVCGEEFTKVKREWQERDASSASVNGPVFTWR